MAYLFCSIFPNANVPLPEWATTALAEPFFGPPVPGSRGNIGLIIPFLFWAFSIPSFIGTAAGLIPALLWRKSAISKYGPDPVSRGAVTSPQHPV